MAQSGLRVDPHAPMPLWAQIGEQVRWAMARGTLGPGDRLPPMRGLADELGIHLHTVRAAYEHLEREGLVARRRGVGTVVLDFDRPSLAASTADVPRFTIGVILAGYSPFYAPLLDGIETGARHRGSMMLLANAHDDDRLAARYVTDLTVRGVDGVIVASVGLDPALTSSAPPIVALDRPGAAEPSVVFDLASGVGDATRHLIEHGHRRIAVLAPPIDWNNGAQIRAGFRDATDGAGIDPTAASVEVIDGYSRETSAAVATRLLDRAAPPTAIVAAGDLPAVGVIGAARDLGRRVPEDLAVIGTGDIELAPAIDPPLTTIALPARDMGARAVELLGLVIAGESTAPVVELPTRLVRRRSCGCP